MTDYNDNSGTRALTYDEWLVKEIAADARRVTVSDNTGRQVVFVRSHVTQKATQPHKWASTWRGQPTS